MEVVLVLCKKLLNQAVDLVDTGQLELIGAGQSHNFQNFLLEVLEILILEYYPRIDNIFVDVVYCKVSFEKLKILGMQLI